MATLNKNDFIGYVGADPVINTTDKGDLIANFRLGVSEPTKDKGKTETLWLTIVTFGNQATFVQEYVHKGSRIYVSGKLKVEEWFDQKNVKQITLKIFAKDIQLLDSKPKQTDLLTRESLEATA